jgi:hypothetical protein
VSIVGTTLIRTVVACGLVALFLISLGHSSPWAWSMMGATALLGLLGIVRAHYRQRLARLWLPQQRETLATARRFDLLLWPLVAVVNWLCLLSSLVGDKVTWRGNRYQILPGGQIRLVRRDPATDRQVERKSPRPPHFDRGAAPTKNRRARSGRKK